MPSIQPNSSRLLCRSRNAFSPAAALWQHFILPNRPIYQVSRQSSTAVEATAPTGVDLVSPESSEVPGTQIVTESESPATVNSKRGENDAPVSLRRSKNLMLDTQRGVKEIGEYNGVVVWPRAPHKMVLQFPRRWPWDRTRIYDKYKMDLWEKNRADQVIPFQLLNHEIHEFHEYMRPTAREALARQSVIEDVRKHVQIVDERYEVEVFGSERTALAFATSDIDLRLTYAQDHGNKLAGVAPPYQNRKDLIRALQKLSSRMKRQADYIRAEIRHARYPLLSMQNTPTGLDVQVVLANDTTVSRELMAKYMEEFPYLHELYTVIKASIDIRGMSDVFRGGFGSYNIFMMIVASLKHSPPEQSDSAHALVNFLRFWATFDTKAHGISIEPVLLYDKSETRVASETTLKKLEKSKTSLPEFMLSLRDPADDTNDLGRKGICVKHFQATCKHLYHQLVYSLDMNTGTMLRSLVGSIYSLDEQARAKLEALGKTIAAEQNKRAGVKSEAHGKKDITRPDKERLRRLARSIMNGKKTTYEIVPPTATESPKTQEQPAVDTSGATFEYGDAIVSAFGMPNVEELTEDEMREAAKIETAETNMVVEVAQDDAAGSAEGEAARADAIGEMTRDEAESETTRVDPVEVSTRDEAQEFVAETVLVNGQDEGQVQSHDLDVKEPPKVNIPKAA